MLKWTVFLQVVEMFYYNPQNDVLIYKKIRHIVTSCKKAIEPLKQMATEK